MTDKELAIIKERAEGTPSGPWMAQTDIGAVYSSDFDDILSCYTDRTDNCRIDMTEEVADFLIHARQDILSLLAEMEELREILGEFLDCADGFAEGEETAEVWDPFWAAYEEARKQLGRETE